MPTPAVLDAIRRGTRPHGAAAMSALALSEHQINRCVAGGILERPFPGVVTNPLVPNTPLKQLAAATLAAGPLAAAWGRSSGALWRLLLHHPPMPEVVVPYRRRVELPGLRPHRSRRFDPSRRVLHHGIWTIDPVTTAIDLGVVLSSIEVAEAIVRGGSLNLFGIEAVRTRIREIARPGRTGVGTAREALELIYIGDRVAESVAELRFHHGPGACGLPPYEYQYEVVVDGKRVRIDFAFPKVKLAIEIDGKEKLLVDDSVTDLFSRQNLLVLDEWTFLHFGWRDICDRPAWVAQQILRKLTQLGYFA